ncbi:hypothetical protein BKA58DRAFT_473546 [Alternaria rosae]|uniref:uncharacterized protein n=1 Tax=Alternaria rosae TaxID=1187941 RepID=UPI001E8E22C5|nr:uncharacterized protein BKA58DRAFT_473546 [Alternaria rosae]KAH6852863.1 hypothetical protein BKA58DRAFT_473546 [Alternaria rosae]
MDCCNNICGVVLTRRHAENYLQLTRSFHNNATYMLGCDNKSGVTGQKQDTWSLRLARHPDPLDAKITDMKARIQSRHVSPVEDWKRIKYESAPIYEMRNWSSHEFGKRGGTLGEENQKFKGLQEAYESLLPTLEELLSKLKSGLEDKAAWAGKYDGGPAGKAAAHEKLEAKRKQEEINTAAQLARIKNGGDAWGCEEWVVAEDAGEERASDPEELPATVTCTNPDEGL